MIRAFLARWQELDFETRISANQYESWRIHMEKRKFV